jgi:uncharacterized membrane protein
MSIAKQITTGRMSLNLRVVSLVLIALGVIVSGYLSYVKFTDVQMSCLAGETFDCGVVQNSSYAEFMGIPIAYFGLTTYIVLGMLVFLEDRLLFLQEHSLILIFGITLFAFVYSMFLVYVQGAILGAWCTWCLMHEAIMTVLFGVTSMRLWRAINE